MDKEIVLSEDSLENNVVDIISGKQLDLGDRIRGFNYIKLYDKDYDFYDEDGYFKYGTNLIMESLVTFNPRFGDIFTAPDSSKWMVIAANVKEIKGGCNMLVVKGGFKKDSESGFEDDSIILKSDTSRVISITCVKVTNENRGELQDLTQKKLPEERLLISDLTEKE